jgi:hypothetical protein
MKHPVLCGSLALALLAPRPAHADSLAWVARLLGGALIGATVVTATTAVATVKNTQAWRQERNPAYGWVGVGAVGGALTLGGGVALVYSGLPRAVDPCDGMYQDHVPMRCPGTTRANTALLASGTVLGAVGAFALSMAIASATTHAPETTAAGARPAGASPAPLSFSLPTLRF